MIPTADTPIPISTNDTNIALPIATTSNVKDNTGERNNYVKIYKSNHDSFEKNATKNNSLIITNNSTNFKYRDLPEETFV